MKDKFINARKMGAFMPKLMKPAFEKFGFPAAALLTDWDQIIGPDLARFTRPEKLKWPKQTYTTGDANTAGDANASKNQIGKGATSRPRQRAAHEQEGATLIMRVDGPAALEVQHSSPQIIERINCYFGYRAIAELRILQAPVNNRATEKKRPQKPVVAHSADLNHPPTLGSSKPLPAFSKQIDSKLGDALKRMWNGIQYRQKGNKRNSTLK